MINIFNIQDLGGASVPLYHVDIVEQAFNHPDVKILFHESDGLLVSAQALAEYSADQKHRLDGVDEQDGTLFVIGWHSVIDCIWNDLMRIFDHVVVFDYMKCAQYAGRKNLVVTALDGVIGLQQGLLLSLAEWGSVNTMAVLDVVTARMLLQYGVVKNVYNYVLPRVVEQNRASIFLDNMYLTEVMCDPLMGTNSVLYSGKVNLL